jgi:hypothetical protein
MLLALDPVLNLFDSRVLLEGPAMFGAALCIACLVSLSVRSADPGDRHGWRVAWAGIGLGLALTTKEPYFFVSVLPVFLIGLRGKAVPRWTCFKVLLIGGGIYLAYIVYLATTGNLGSFWSQTTSGISRLAGSTQISGFNAAGSPSLVSRIFANGGLYASTYLVIVVASLISAAFVLALWRERRSPLRPIYAFVRGPMEIFIVWQLSAAAYLMYAVFFGTIETQTFYLLVAPSIVVFVLGVVGGYRRGWVKPAVCLVALSIVGAYNVGTWAVVHSKDDDSYQRLATWMAHNQAIQGTRWSVTEDSAQFFLQGVVLTRATSTGSICATKTDYVLLSTALVDRGYGEARAPFASALQRDAKLVFQSKGPTLGSLRVYDVRGLRTKAHGC